MKKYLMIFGIMILSIIPILKVKADDTNINYSYGGYSTNIHYYENVNKFIVKIPRGDRFHFELTKTYYLAYWQGQYFVLLQANSPISFTKYSGGYKAVSDDNIYASIVRWSYSSSVQDNYKDVIYELGTYKTGSEDMLLASTSVSSWGQILSNHDVYVVTDDASTLYLEKNLSTTNTEKFSIGYHTFPSIVEDGKDSFIIVSNGAGTEYFGFGIWLITYNKSDIPYLGVQNTNSTSYPYELMLFTSPTSSDVISYKAYKLTNNNWVLTYDRENYSTNGGKYIVGLNNIYYSTEKVYMYKYTYKNSLTFSYDEFNTAYKNSSDCPNLIETKTYTIEDSSTYTGYENVIYTPPQKLYLKYALTEANDLEGNSIYNVRFNAVNYNSSYQYLIKTDQDSTWVDITENLNNEAYQYDYIIKYNTTLYMQVLDANNRILETKTHTITGLTDYGFIITHNLAEDLNTRPVYAIRVDAKNVYNENYTYQYTYDGQKYYNMEFVDNVYIMNHALNIPIIYRIVDEKNNTIHTQIYDGDFSEMEKNINFSESTDIVDSEKRITIGVDFTEYLKFYDMYNFRAFVNGEEYSLQDAFYIEFVSTESNYIKSLDVKLMLDNMTIEEYTYRIGTINGTGGGSDTDFDGMYDNILENELENELKQQDYSTIPGMVEAVKSFIKATGDFITTFFELIMYFFNKLNVWIKTCVIALFIELVIFKTIKAVRK